MAKYDAHVHVHHPDNPLPEHPLFVGGMDAKIDDLVSVLDEHGVDGALLVPVNPDRRNLEYAASGVVSHPGRFAAIAVQDAEAEDQGKHYVELAETFGVQGIRVFNLQGSDGDAVALIGTAGLLGELADRGHNLWLYPKADAYRLAADIAREFSGLNVVFNLLGLPWPGVLDGVVKDQYGRPTLPTSTVPTPHMDDLRVAAQLDNTFVHYGGHFQYSEQPHPHLDLQDHVTELYTAFGADKMMWMTDWPWIATEPGYGPLLDDLKIHLPQLSSAEEAAIVGGTLRRIVDFG